MTQYNGPAGLDLLKSPSFGFPVQGVLVLPYYKLGIPEGMDVKVGFPVKKVVRDINKLPSSEVPPYDLHEVGK